ncbi:integumentary mucin C.1-like [Oreochromis aureus]|uniref:integumentary mucin C.1-like n=1 Tax=Oreochromis aureus TaxID=47969 RepID=UPI001953F177|nr:integumentary mucin C.1-like [Oreochromis aureus]
MKLLFSLFLLWALSTTAGALQCQTCTDSTCSSTVPVTCSSSETMCVTATILATSSGTPVTQIYKACVSSSLCPAVTSQTLSVNLGFQSALASAQCCSTDNCNSATLPNPASQSNNGGVCNFCDPSTGQCSSTLQCQGVENQCFQSIIKSSTSTYPAQGCASANLCAVASSLGSLPFMPSVGTVSGVTCLTAPTTTAAPTTTIPPTTTTTTATTTTTTTATTTTTTPTTTTTTATTTTTTPTTTTTTATTKTTTPTTTATTASTTKSDACSIRLGMIHLLLGLLLFTFH